MIEALAMRNASTWMKFSTSETAVAPLLAAHQLDLKFT